jgi:RHS repeat-associated protein
MGDSAFGLYYGYRSRMANVTTGTVRNMTLTYDDAGNVRGQTDNTTGDAVSYTYDSLNRLKGATGFSGGTTAAYSYSTIDNLLTKQEGSSSLTLTYPATGQPRPHAVTATTGTTGTQTLSLGYDANGNLVTQGASTYTFDAENRLKTRTVTGGTASYTYDGTGTLLKRTNADGSWTAYISGVYEKNSDGTVRKYFDANGQTVAMRSVPSGGGTGTLFYMLQDHLSSTVKVLGSSFATYAEMKYWPFGGTRSTTGSSPTDKLYTGQREEPGDSALGLYNYKARFYSTMLGRFVSADPVASLNRYTYTANNPLRFVDPSGLTLMIACGTNNHCETGQDAGQYRNAIIAEWMRERRYPGASRAWLENLFDTYFLNAFLKIRGFNGLQSAQTFGVVFLDTGSLFWEVAKDRLPLAGPGDVGPFLNANYYFFGARGADYWIGFSQGGQVVFEALQRAWDHKLSMPKGAVLIEPGIGQANYLSPGILEATRVITWSDTGFSYIDAVGGVRGWIWGAYNFKTSDCGELNQHCSHGKWQGVMMAMVYLGAGDLGDWMIPAFADALNVTVQCHVSYYSHRMGVDGC